ncbi:MULTISPECIES: enoyl-CoA hydratase/isomerase family protein [unclassified Novosphingobium]|uniref:enoyl-CoA hydratase/isomerase family protein n=1 Tax=unclassified Novosphingobium TaxID=2644732 RepID=UPI00135AC4BA|nr:MULTISPECIES: enoyl-CoA hydratase/isomerase family protein [unclassified Novosphingobium]
MDFAGLTVSTADLEHGGYSCFEPVAFVDLAATPYEARDIRLPPCPLIGIGGADHPLASKLDTVVESRSQAAALGEAAISQSLAASTLVQLLRLLPSLSADDGLTAESLAYATLQGSTAHRDWIARRKIPSCDLIRGAVSLSRQGDEVIAMLNRGEAGNAIDRHMRDALHEAFVLVNMDRSISRITLRAHGKAFSLGADLGEFGTTIDPATAHMIRSRTLPAREAVRCADRFAVEIDGACIGAGLELAAFASRITATRRSWFQLPELAMGVLPGAGGCVSVTRRIGRQRTALMVLSGRRVGARQALEWGLIDALVD